MEPQIIEQYVATQQVRFEYHHYIVIDGNTGGSESRHAAEASECANEQGEFWNFHKMLFANQGAEASGAFSDRRLQAFAQSLGLDTNKFNACFNAGRYAQNVRADEATARSLGATSTPTLLVNGTLVNNPLDFGEIQSLIQAAQAQ